MGLRLLIKYILPAVCTILLCHSGSLRLMERYLGAIYHDKIENRYIGNTDALFDGTVRLHDSVSKNIQKFLRQDKGVIFFNLNLNILITSECGKIIYPADDFSESSMDADNGLWDSVSIARENFDLLHQDLKVFVVTRLKYISLASCIILIFYILLACMVFLLVKRNRETAMQKSYTQGELIRKLKVDEKQLRAEEQKLKEVNETSKQLLKDLEKQRRNLFESLKAARAEQSEELRRANINEEEMIHEIDCLEKKVSENLELQESKELEIENLRQKLDKYERRKSSGKKRRTFERVSKRFVTLYKNVEMNRRAFTGFFELNDEQQIKAEEIVHQLNQDVGSVTIKRKVFSGKKNKNTSFEVLFAYNGRLYFRNLEGGSLEILTIGTKNTQDRDMEFLHNL